MKILSLDSSQNTQSFSVYNTEINDFLISESFSGRSSDLVERLRAAFSSINLNLKDLGLLAVNIGPGSFTGIRNALVISKTLVLELSLKLITVNTFELMRFEHGVSEDSPIAIDAFKNNYFVSLNSNYLSNTDNFFAISTEFTIHKFKQENLSKLIIEYLIHKKLLQSIADSSFDLDNLKPYYLREPSLGKK